MFNPYNCAELSDFAPTLTAQGDSITKSGTVLIIEDFYKSRPIRIYSDISPTLRSERIGLKVLEIKQEDVNLHSKCRKCKSLYSSSECEMCEDFDLYYQE